MVDSLTKLSNYLQEHENGIDVRWTLKVIDEAKDRQAAHLQHVEQFLNDMYAVMVDPVEQPKMKVAEMCALLLKTAQEQRERDYQKQPSLSFRDGWDAKQEKLVHWGTECFGAEHRLGWVKTRYPQKCVSGLHKGKMTQPAGTRMVAERAKAEGKFGTCYTCEPCVKASAKELDGRTSR